MLKYEELIKNINILLVDDDTDYIDITELSLRGKGYNVDVVTNGTDAIKEIKKNKYQIVLLDYFMDDMTGEQVVEEVRKWNNEVIIILQTGFSGEKPPIEMMKKLKIQNYHDKTDGIDKLNLQIMSAVRIFLQQTAIDLSQFRTKAIGKLMTNISSSIKSNLVSMSAGIEITNMMLQQKDLSNDQVVELNKYYYANKENIEKIDRILSIVAKEYSENQNDIMKDDEIIEVLELIINSDVLKIRNINFKVTSSLRNSGFMSGGVSEIIFLVSEIILEIANNLKENSNIELTLTENEENWYFKADYDDELVLGFNSKIKYKNILNAIMYNKTTFSDKGFVIQIGKNS